MTKLEFGVDEPPPASKERMAYIARRATCGHIVIAQADSRPGALGDFVSYIAPGMILDRVPSEQVRDEGFCTCPQPVQTAMDL